MKETYLILVVAFCLCYFLPGSLGEPPGYDKYTKIELELLPKFRELIQNDIPHHYMAENKYLVRFLRAKKHDIKDAAVMIRENFRWRKENDVDGVHKEDWSKWEKLYPFLYTVDRWGRPGISTGLKDFNVRKLLRAGKKNEITRYLLYGMEKSVFNIHRVSNETGREIIEGYLLFNMLGYNMRTHACLACIPAWIELAQSYENYYPQLAYRIIVINAPRILQGLYQVCKPFMSEHTQNAMRFFSVDKSEWYKELSRLFSPENLLKEFGGTLDYKFQDIHYEED